MKVQLPQKLIRSPAINIVEDLIKAKYFSQVLAFISIQRDFPSINMNVNIKN